MIQTISLNGDPKVLKEGPSISFKEIDLETFPEEEIVYPDLVFTLKYKKGAYSRPLVVRKKTGLYVIANTLCFRAAKEAGLEKIDFDLLSEKDLPLGKIMQDYNIGFPQPLIKKDYLKRLLFLNEQIRNIPLGNEYIELNSLNNSQEFDKNNCIAYKMLFKGRSPPEKASSEIDFIDNAVEKNGPLRSIDGLIKKKGVFSKYFRR